MSLEKRQSMKRDFFLHFASQTQRDAYDHNKIVTNNHDKQKRNDESL